MRQKKRHSPWLWIPTMSAAEEIPTAVATFVALLMFSQLGVSNGMACLMSSLLFVPWILRSFVRHKVRSSGYFKMHIHAVEIGTFLVLSGLAFYLNGGGVNVWAVWGIMFVACVLTAWHDLLGRMYYARMLYPRQQAIYSRVKIFSATLTTVVTYGVLIIFVGFLEIFFRSMTRAWSMDTYLASGVLLMLLVVNCFVMQNPRVHDPYRYESMRHAFKNELHAIERIRKRDGAWRVIVTLGLLLLPQALMFNTRVFFLLARDTDGGLDCSVQELGFAQGTIGVLAFCTGLVLGRNLVRRYGIKVFWPLCLLLVISPVFYAMMAHHPLVGNMPALCCMTFWAQLCFGLGLNVCRWFVSTISGERYRNTIDMLHIPMIAGLIVVPMACSGWLCDVMGFERYFICDALSGLLGIAALLLLNTKKYIVNATNNTD